MQVLVVGGTGFVGTKLTRELVDRGHTVTVLSRTADAERRGGNVRAVRGDVTDYESIEGAFADQDVVVNLVALSPLFTPSGGDERHERVHLGGTENVVRAAETHGVGKLVQTSALGADPDGPTAYLRAKGAAERVVRDADLDRVIVRPSVVFGDGGEFVDFTKALTTPYVTGLPGGGTTRFQPIWVGDLVPMLADAVEGTSTRDRKRGASDVSVEDGDRVGRVYELGGPEVLTLADVTRRVYRASGTPVAVVPVPTWLAGLGLHVGARIPGFPMGPDQYRSLRLDNTVEENDVRALGRAPDELRTLGAYLAAGADDRPTAGSRSPWTARSTLLAFGFLALTWQLPNLVDVYDYGGVPRALFVPAYLLMLVLYDAPWGLENVVYAIDPLVPGAGAFLWEGGLVVTYYLFAVVATWAGRLVASGGRASPGSGEGDESRGGSP